MTPVVPAMKADILDKSEGRNPRPKRNPNAGARATCSAASNLEAQTPNLQWTSKDSRWRTFEFSERQDCETNPCARHARSRFRVQNSKSQKMRNEANASPVAFYTRSRGTMRQLRRFYQTNPMRVGAVTDRRAAKGCSFNICETNPTRNPKPVTRNRLRELPNEPNERRWPKRDSDGETPNGRVSKRTHPLGAPVRSSGFKVPRFGKLRNEATSPARSVRRPRVDCRLGKITKRSHWLIGNPCFICVSSVATGTYNKFTKRTQLATRTPQIPACLFGILRIRSRD